MGQIIMPSGPDRELEKSCNRNGPDTRKAHKFAARDAYKFARGPNARAGSLTMPALRSPFPGGVLPAGEIDPDYLYWLQHVRFDGDSYTLELPARGASPPTIIRYEAPLASSDGECVSDPSPGRLSTNRRAEEKESSASEDVAPAWNDPPGDVDEDYRLFLENTRLVDGCLVLEIGDVVVNYDQPDAARSGGSSEAQEERDKTPGKEAAVSSPGKRIGVGAKRDRASSDAPARVVREQYACDWRADPTPGQEVNDNEDEGASGMKGVDWEVCSSNGHDPRLRGNSEGKKEQELGIVWPARITQRADSDFKRRLIQALTKPVERKEYYKLFDMATIRTPLMKLRQVRTETKFYPTEEMGNSYLDHYPDLSEQVMNSGRRHGLALLRGLFFWLQNNAHEKQFKPWVDDSKDQEVIRLVD